MARDAGPAALRRIIWSREAQDDVFDIAEHYDHTDPDLANEIVLRIEQSPFPLREFPAMGEAVFADSPVRKWRLPKTPFLLFDVPADGCIEIRRVRHGASDWRD